MNGPAWLPDSLAGVMIATAAYCLCRMAAARRWQRQTSYDVDLTHVLMGVAMAGMLAPRLNPLAGSGWARGGWEVLFGAAAAWFGGQAVRGYRRRPGGAGHSSAGHHLQHLLACGAMLYMFFSATPARAGGHAAGTAMGGPAATGLPGAGVPALALGFTLGLLGYAIWTTDRLMSLTRVAVGAAGSMARDPRPVLAGFAPGDPAVVRSAAASHRALASVAPMSARLSACCDIVMGVTMGYMLITMM